MDLETHVWELRGVSPLMQSNPESMMNADETQKLKTKKKTYDPEEEARVRTYKNNGHFVHPSSSIRRALIVAVTGRKFGKITARNIVSAAVFPAEEWITILMLNGEPVKKYEIDKRTVVISKSRVLRCRPKFTDWMMRISLDVDLEVISIDQITESLNLAGRNIGIGEFRPDPSNSKSGVGTFGRFVAKYKSEG